MVKVLSFIFIVHPIVRLYIIGSDVISVHLWIVIYAVLSILAAMAYRWLLKYIPNFQMKSKN